RTPVDETGQPRGRRRPLARRGGARGPLPYFFERITPCSPNASAEASCPDQTPWPPTCRPDEPWPVCDCLSGWWVLFRFRASPNAPTEFDCSTEPPCGAFFASLPCSSLPCFLSLPFGLPTRTGVYSFFAPSWIAFASASACCPLQAPWPAIWR